MPEPYRGYLYYDPETGEPVTAKDYRSLPVQRSGLPGSLAVPHVHGLLPQTPGAHPRRANGPLVPSRQGLIPRSEFEKHPVTTESIAAGLEATAAATAKPIAHLAAFQRGEFPAGSILADTRVTAGISGRAAARPTCSGCWTTSSVPSGVGRGDRHAVPCYADDYFGFIDPERDWYKTPLLRQRFRKEA